MSATSTITRANVKTHARRYIATGLAVIISMIFVVASLVVSSGITSLLTRSITDPYNGASAEITVKYSSVDPEKRVELDSLQNRVENVPGVTATTLQMVTFEPISAGGHTVNRSIYSLNPKPFYQPRLAEGTLPGNGEVLLDASAAETLGVSVGDTVSVETYVNSSDSEASGASEATGNLESADQSGVRSIDLTVSGISQGGIISISAVYVSPQTATELGASMVAMLVAGSDIEPSVEKQEQLVAAIQNELADTSGFAVESVHEITQEQLAQIKAGSAATTAMLLIFPVIALVVAAIVVHTTFQVVLEQRRRELALLRALGATSKQVRSILVRETFTVGFVSSLIGVILGLILGVIAIYAGGMATSWGQAIETVNPVSPAVALVAGTLVTVLVGLRPALGMARQRPLAALAPVNQAAPAARKRHTVRLVFGLIGLVLSIGMAGFGLFLQTLEEPNMLMIFLLCFFAGMIGLVFGILAVSVILPHLTHLAGKLLGSKPVARMARENTGRNPDRTAATGTGIVIGVTLIVLMMTGALSTKATMIDYLNDARPIDLTITSPANPGQLDDSFQEKLKDVEGVKTITSARSTEVTVQSDRDRLNDAFTKVVEAPDLTAVARSFARLNPAPPVGSVQLDKDIIAPYTLPDTVEVCAQNCQTLNVVPIDDIGNNNGVIAPETLVKLTGGDASVMPVAQVYLRLNDDANVDSVIDAIDHLGENLQVFGGAQERSMYLKAINGMLGATVGLLAVSVLVALVGLANTLSLSVAERTRENGLLRALGLSKGQMQNMLRLEAVLIAVVAALVGTVFGVILGWLGMQALPFEDDFTRILVIPWWQIGAVVLIAVVAALLASWLPGRRAARTSPVEALAAE